MSAPPAGLVDWAIVRYLHAHPRDQVLLICATQLHAVRRGHTIQTLARNSAIGLPQGFSQADDWQLTTGGGLRTVGVGAALRGMRVDAAFIDADLTDPRLRFWWRTEASTRLAPAAAIHPDMPWPDSR